MHLRPDAPAGGADPELQRAAARSESSAGRAENLLLGHQLPAGGPVPAQHRGEGQPQLLLRARLLPLQQARRGAQEALPPHQPHTPHVPVLGHQPHHRHLGQLRQELLGGAVPGAAAELGGAAAAAEDHRGEAPGAVQGAGQREAAAGPGQ